MARVRHEYDTRSFIELWHSLPEVGRRMLTDALVKKGVRADYIKRYLNGTLPSRNTANAICRVMLKSFGLYTKVETLFPDKERTERIVAHFKPAGWDGKVQWPSLDDDEEENHSGGGQQ